MSMIEQIGNHYKLDESLKWALHTVDREKFLPAYAKHFSTSLDAVYLGDGRWVQSPLTIAKTISHLTIKKTDKVLEVGCGNGYQSVILKRLCDHVVAMDSDENLLAEAHDHFRRLNLPNISTVKVSEDNWIPINEKFDRILFSLSVKEISHEWFKCLTEDGILIAPIELTNDYHILTKYHRKGNRLIVEEIEPCNFVSLNKISQKT